MIEIEVQIKEMVFPRYGKESDFKIYGALPCNEEDIEIHDLKFNSYHNITLNGIMPNLEVGSRYKARLIEKKHPKHGVGYEVQSIFQDVPKSVDEQKAYLMTLLTENQVNNIYQVYEGQDVIQLMKDNTFDYNLVRGLGEATYNGIRTKVLGNLELQEALVALSQYGLTYSIVSKLVKKYGSARMVVDKIEQNPYVLTEVDGIGFVKCDAYALSMGVEPESEFRIEACINHILNEEADSNGHSWVSRQSLIKKATELLSIDQFIVDAYIEDYEGSKLYITEERVAKRNLYNYEKWIFESVKRLLSQKPKEITELEAKIDKAEGELGFKFTDEQRDAIRTAVKENVIGLTGKAGTGKTTILKGIVSVLKQAGDFKSFYACALSGKAAQRIKESTKLEASTIHRLLGWNQETGGFGHDFENPLPEGVDILDEASMANSYIFNALTSAIRTGSKFVIVGDIEQLEPIGAGNIFKDMILSESIPTAYLTQVHRQAMMSGILSTANQIREGVQFNDQDNYENRVIGELKDLHFKPYKKAETVKKAIIQACEQYRDHYKEFDLLNFQVIVPLKSRGEICTKKLNVELQQIFNPDIKPALNRNGYDFKVGDKVIQQGNNYDVNVFNGTLGIVSNIDTVKKEITIDFQGSGSVKYNQEDMGQIDMAYALTVHKVQGSQFDVVIGGIDYSSYVLLSRQLVYTLLTRASKLCILAVENDALRHAIRTDKSSNRNTFLKEMLIEGLTSDK
jgi:exodeoxyribonuclease V alpha subunit